MKSITTLLYGGLGNQLFQYAAARSISLRQNANLIFDLAGFKFDYFYLRNLDLDNFNIPRSIVRVNEIRRFKLLRAMRATSERMSVVARLLRPKMLIEHSTSYDPAVIATKVLGQTCMIGYWQDERYFADCADAIRNDLSPIAPFSVGNADFAARIRSCDRAVAVHVRRLHGLSAQVVSQHASGGIAAISQYSLSVDHYQRAIEYIQTRVQSPVYFIFSDDPVWAKDNLRIPGEAVFLEKKRGPDHEDILLMSLCRHHVIANSSFSWWGAWLAGHAGQIVVAPTDVKYTPNIPPRWHLLQPAS